MSPTSRDDSTSHQELRQLAAEFEAHCAGGTIPSIEPYLRRVEQQHRDVLLTQLINCEIRHRRRLGLLTDPASYRKRYPQLGILEIEQDGSDDAQDTQHLAPNSRTTFSTAEESAAETDDERGASEPDAPPSTPPPDLRSPADSNLFHAAAHDVSAESSDFGNEPATGGTKTAGGNDDTVVRTVQDGPRSADGSGRALPVNVDRYRVDGVLGEGGFGVVYLGFDPELQRKVAIKVAHGSGQSERLLEELLSEARMLARLDHPHIVPVHDVGRDRKLGIYIISKFIDGQSLRDQMDAERSAVEIAELIAQMADALHVAHMQSVVHRDIKPNNILIDTSGQPFIVDFGLALADCELSRRRKSFAGTPAYMSPEQSMGEGHRVDGRSDIFSLGVILYELMVGCRPFRAGNLDDLLNQIADHEPRPPRQIRDMIPIELERICLKSLAKRASDRYTTAQDMAADLRAFVEDASASEALLSAPKLAGRAPGGDESARSRSL